MDRLLTLEMFVAVVDEGSFSAAARRLRASPPAVTRGIAELERRLGTALFHRSTRAVTLTDDGAGFVGQVRKILAEVVEAERRLAGARIDPGGQLYVTASTVFGSMHVTPAVAGLIDRYPSLDVRLLLFDRNVRLVEEGIDVAVRIGALADSSFRAVRIGSVRQVIVASPGYLARHGVPAGPADLSGHRLIGSSGPRAVNEWRLNGRQPTALRPRLVLNTVDSAIAAAQEGVGLANFLDYQVEDALDSGRLIEVLKPAVPEMLPISLLFEASRANAPSIRAFVDAMRERARLCRWGRT